MQSGHSGFCCAHALAPACACELDLLWHGESSSNDRLASRVYSFLLCCIFYTVKTDFGRK